MNPLGTRARAEELARLLDGAVSGPGTLTAGHATLASRLRTLAPRLDATPRAEFRAALRTRLVAVATVQAATLADAPVAAAATPGAKAFEAAVSWSHSHKAQRRIGVLAGSMAGVIAFTGVGIASSRSLPGAPFYAVKRGAEAVQLDLAKGDVAKGTKHLEFAATRLREVQAMARGEGELSLGHAGTSTDLASSTAFGRSLQAKVTDTLTDFDEETRDGRVLLEGAYRADGKTEALRILQRFATQQQSRLTALLPQLPAGAKPSAQDSLALVTEVGVTTATLLALGTCTGECDPTGSGPTLPTPAPLPGVSAAPTAAPDDNGVPDCQCAQPTTTPQPSTEPQPAAPTDEPTDEPPTGPTTAPTTSPSPSPSASPSSGPVPPIPTLPPLPPLPVPTVPPLPLPLPTTLTDLIPTLGTIPRS